MKKIICIFLLLRSYCCFAQNVADLTKYKPFRQHSVYVELLGNVHLFYSMCYDYTFKLKEKHKLSLNCGFQYMPTLMKNTYILSVSPQINYLYGKTHHLEIGIGGTGYVGITSNNENTTGWAIPLRIGYRYQKEGGGLFFKVAYTPAINTMYRNHSYYGNGEFGEIVHCLWGGIAFGYTFK